MANKLTLEPIPENKDGHFYIKLSSHGEKAVHSICANNMIMPNKQTPYLNSYAVCEIIRKEKVITIMLLKNSIK